MVGGHSQNTGSIHRPPQPRGSRPIFFSNKLFNKGECAKSRPPPVLDCFVLFDRITCCIISFSNVKIMSKTTQIVIYPNKPMRWRHLADFP